MSAVPILETSDMADRTSRHGADFTGLTMGPHCEKTEGQGFPLGNKEPAAHPKLRERLSKSDIDLLRSAWAELASAPKARVGRSSLMRSACFSARFVSVCERCGSPISVGQDIRYHRDYDGPVHAGCRPRQRMIPTAVGGVSGELRMARATSSRQPGLCVTCNLEHAGDCW